MPLSAIKGSVAIGPSRKIRLFLIIFSIELVLIVLLVDGVFSTTIVHHFPFTALMQVPPLHRFLITCVMPAGMGTRLW